MVTEAGAAPALERADIHLHLADPARRQKDVVDVIGWSVLGAVAPVERRHGLLAVQLAAHGVVGADQAELLLENADLGRVVDAPARLVPDRVAVEVARDHRRRMAEEIAIARHGAPQRPELALADAA